MCRRPAKQRLWRVVEQGGVQIVAADDGQAAGARRQQCERSGVRRAIRTMFHAVLKRIMLAAGLGNLLHAVGGTNFHVRTAAGGQRM